MSDMLSQEEIDALLKGTSQILDDNDNDNDKEDAVALNDDEKDALGEIGNISMGTSATTLFTLLGQKVTITTPQVTVISVDELTEQYTIPFVVVEVKYKEGIEGTNLLVLQEDDVKVITDIMMGGDGTNVSGELTEIHLSAIGEAMNQMVGSSATSLSEMFNNKIDISPPKAISMKFSEGLDEVELFKNTDKIVKIAFKMTVGTIIDSEIMQILPIDFAKQMVKNLLEGGMANNTVVEPEPAPVPVAPMPSIESPQNVVSNHVNEGGYNTNYDSRGMNHNVNTNKTMNVAPVNVQPVQFQSFDETPMMSDTEKGNINLIRDVPLKVTVELGRTTKRISEILEFCQGTVIELDKLVGEPLDILVNGQFMAKGEVVVIDENYGIRVTDITNNAKKINKVK